MTIDGVTTTADNADSVEHSPLELPGVPTVTVIGDGQLARMMQTAAIELGLSLRVLAGSRTASAAQVSGDVQLGDYTNVDDLLRVTKGSAAVTFDHEHVPTEHLQALIDAGLSVQPGPGALVNAQDKLVMRRRLAELGAPIPAFAAIDSVADAEAFFDEVKGAVCLKARRGGYDGHGVWFPEGKQELTALVEKLLEAGTPLMAEAKVALTHELSALVTRRPSGETKAWQIAESVQKDGICVEAVAPAPELDPQLAARAGQLAMLIADNLGVTGVLAVELFQFTNADGEQDIAVNELAMRPHNTGHWTQDGSVTSQFEQHLRAVLDYPLGTTEATAPVAVMANVLGAPEDPEMPMQERVQHVLRRFPQAKIHLYGKEHRAGRKIGHVNLRGQDSAQTRHEAHLAAQFLVQAQWEDGYAPSVD
ncbi:5-(carboxyamino)imidazole ribonucleotide synthase [Corynebacterium incognita]|uniref:N5-carboxyaminoimidazole ribonucleotide synthase n=1 Tax=Corynebacterium incognita TaxID=2754725 RepID=A0A7G7CSL0_9CORY|nr:5-(carboxyamino)imidazole ribonucleotide synthase [Corynebacterium incognita]